MTYLERRIITASSSGKPSPAGSIAPNTNGSGRNPLGPRNSLDYWQKAEDRNGMSYYWNGPISKGLENVYAQHSPVPQQLRRPAPFPLTLPPSSGTPPSRSTTVSPLPTVYQNVPTMPRARLIQSSSRQNLSQPQTTVTQPSSAPKAPRDSPIFAAANGKPRDNMLVWSVTNQNGNPAGSGNPISSVPRYNQNNTTTIQIGGGMRQSSPKYGEKVKNSRQKPRWGRFMQSLCCCVVAPQRTAEKTAAQPHQNTSLLITQVQKNGSVSSAPSSDVVRPANDYSHTPVLQHHGANGTIVNGCASPQNGTIVPPSGALLPPLRAADSQKKCLIIDLDETLVHSSFKPVKNADFVIPVEIDGIEHKVYVLKRPYVDEFLAHVGEKYECVLFTASLAKYADPVADLLDKRGVFRSRLFREACVYHKGNYVKDLARLGRDLNQVLIIDNSPASYAFHPENAIPVQTWFDDPTDVELLDILPVLDRLAKVDSVYDLLRRTPPYPMESNGTNSAEVLLSRS